MMTETRNNTRRIRLVSFLAASLAGIAGSAAFVLACGKTTVLTPLWAEVAFFPGFVAGHAAQGLLKVSIEAATWVGCVGVGLAYALAALAIVRIVSLVRAQRQEARSRGPRRIHVRR